MKSLTMNLLGLERSAMQAFFERIGEPSYRATQLLQWIHQYGITDFELMTNFSKALRERLTDIACIQPPQIETEQCARDGTRKWVLRLNCDNLIETVFIPEDDRGTLCVSSQVGCMLNCSFCATGKQGFNRNLSTAEIIGQVWIAVRQLSYAEGKHDHAITNVVLMGMGEPLLNFNNVLAAVNIMMDDYAYGLSKRRVTLSTSGVVPAMEKLSQVSNISLAVSLHAPNDELRNTLVPINRKYPIATLMDVCRRYFEGEPRRSVTFEYVMLDHVNDSKEHAIQLVKLLQNMPAKVNLIPFNTISGSEYQCSSQERIDAFRDVLYAAGICTITRKTRGDDIAAACGQLVGQVKDRTKRSQRLREQSEDEVKT